MLRVMGEILLNYEQNNNSITEILFLTESLKLTYKLPSKPTDTGTTQTLRFHDCFMYRIMFFTPPAISSMDDATPWRSIFLA